MALISKINGIPVIDTKVTGFTFDNINQLDIIDNNGTTFSVNITSLSAATISATTFYGDGSNLTGISGGTDFYTTGVTLINNVLYFDRNDTLSAYTVDLSSLSTTGGSGNDTYITGSTITGNTTLILTNNTGGTVTQELEIERELSFRAEEFALNTATRVVLTPLVLSALRFAGTGAIDDAGVSFIVPSDYKSGGELSYTWRSSTTSTGNTATTFFDLYTGDTSNLGSLTTSVETFSISDTPENTANVFIFSPSVTPSTEFAPNMQIHLRTYRDPSFSGDTLNSDLDIINLIFRYNAKR